jgi:predicted RNA-binding Zn-ribbon protein involved in translation (DUF1610 family)
MEKVFITNNYRTLPNNYRAARCECLVRDFIAFHEDIQEFECPNCGSLFRTNGKGSVICRVKRGRI